MERLGAGPIGLIGYSMGGRLALYFALRYPRHCRCLILESASPGLNDPAERAVRLQHDLALARRLESERLDSFILEWYRQPLFASLARFQDKIQRLIERRSQSDPVQLSRALRVFSTGAQEPVWTNLRDAPPSLLIVGSEDAKFRDIAVRMQAPMPSAVVKVVDGAGHNVHFEKPDRFIELVSNYLSEEKG